MPAKLSKNDIRRGSVVLVPFPNSNLRSGKLRPALVIQSDELDSEIPQIVVAMISSNLRRAGRKCRILIEMETEVGKTSGLVFDSVIMTDNLATILLSEVSKVVGNFDRMGEVNKALRHTLAL